MTPSRPIVLALVLLHVGGCPKKLPVQAPVEASSTEPASSEQVDPREATARLAEATRLLSEGTEPAAIRARGVLEQVVRATPKDPIAWYDLGVAQWRLGALNAADEALTHAVGLDAKLAAGWRALGLVEQQAGDVTSALARFDQGLAVAPQDLDLHLARIGGLRAAGRANDAIEASKAALKISSKSLTLYNLMGLTWLDLGRIDLARFVFEKAETVEGAEADPTIQANFGWALYEAGERYPAEQRLKRAVELDGQFVPGLVYLARFYLDDHAFPDAIPLLERARALAPTNHGVLVDLGVAYKGAGRFDEARAVWEKALALRPEDPLPQFDLGILLADDLKAYDDAVARFQAYIDANGPEAELARTYVDACRKDQEKAEAARKREEERKKRAADKEERERLLREAEKANPAGSSTDAPSGPWGSAPQPAPQPAPAPQTAPAPQPTPQPTPAPEPAPAAPPPSPEPASPWK